MQVLNVHDAEYSRKRLNALSSGGRKATGSCGLVAAIIGTATHDCFGSNSKHRGSALSYFNGPLYAHHKVCKPDYISNGAVIQAAVDMGYEWFRVGARSPNVYFYMNLELPRAYRDGKRPVEGVPIIVMDHNARMLSE